MENKINIAELLRDCPKGMELDCAMYDNAYFEQVDEKAVYPIVINIGNTNTISLTKEGHWNKFPNAKCVIFPKGKTTWEGFQRPFKDGDILTSDKFPFIYKNCDIMGIVESYCGIDTKGNFWKASKRWTILDCVTFAAEEEKAKLFDAIKANGYKWNAETKTLEKLPKFKIGDEIVKKNSISNSYLVNSVSCDYYGLKLPNNTGIGILRVDEQDDWELIPHIKPIFKKGDKVRSKKGFPDRIARIIENVGDTFYTLVSVGKIDFTDQDNWELVPTKFDISKLKHFDKVLVRDFDSEVWEIDFFSRLLDGKHFKCIGASYVQCIPYKGNEYLHNTTNACNPFYKTWEK